MSNKIQRRLEEVASLLPCPVSGCSFLHGAVFEIGWKEFGRDLELRVHIEPEESVE